MVTTSRVGPFLRARAFARAVHDRLYTNPAVSPQSTVEFRDEFEVVVSVVRTSLLLSAVARAFEGSARAYRHSAVAAAASGIIEGISRLETWQRIRLLGWMLFVATLTAGLVAGFGDIGSRTLLIGIWAAAIGLACGMVLGSRPIAAAWEDYRARTLHT